MIAEIRSVSAEPIQYDDGVRAVQELPVLSKVVGLPPRGRQIALPVLNKVVGLPPRGRQIACLGDLDLPPQALEQLHCQGWIAAEYRGHAGPYFKLRLRVAGKQVVRYLGTDAQVAAKIQDELFSLQRRRRLDLTPSATGRQAIARYLAARGAIARKPSRSYHGPRHAFFS